MTAPGGTPGLPSGTVLTLDNLQSRLQDMSPAAMKSRAVDWFPAKANSTTGGNPAAGASPFGVLTDIWSRFNATVAAADPAAVNSVSDLDNLFDEFVHNLPVVGKFVELVEAFTGDYEGDDEVLIGIQNLFGTIPKLIGGLLSGSWIPGLDASKITSGSFLETLIPTLTAAKIPTLDASKIQTGTFADGFLPGLGSLVTGFFSALTGNTDPDATKEQTAAQLQELAATTAANASAIAALQSSSDGVTSGMNGGDEFTRVVANGLGTGWETLYYSGTDANGYWRVDGNQAVWVDGGSTPRTSRHIRTDPADMTTLTDYQKTVFVQGTTSSETNAGIRILHRVNAARSEYVICQITDALALFGYTVSGSAGETQFPGASSVATTGAVGVSWTVESGTLLGVRVFRLSRNGNAILSYSDTGNLSAYGPNNRGWGWGGMAVNRAFGQGTPSACTRITIADNVPRAVVAPTARMYRTSTSSYTFPNGWRNITSGFWQFVARHAPDVIEASTALGGFIIKKAGAFAFNVAIRMGSDVSAVLKLALYVNGVMTQVKAASSGGSMKSGEAMTAVFDEYCAPGDVVTVGTWHSGFTGNYILAEATGMETHFTGTATALSFN